MGTIADRLILAFCCVAVMLAGNISSASVVAILLAIVVNCITIYLENRAVNTALIVVYAMLCMRWPEFICMAPFAAYELCYRHHELPLLSFLLPCFYWRTGSAELFLMFLLTFYLAWKTRRYEEKERRFCLLENEHLELKAREEIRQREMTRHQDNEIYMAMLAERNRIAREIHDNVGHMLSRSILQVGALRAVNQQEKLKPSLEALKATLDTAMNSIRESVHDLRDEAFDLEAAVRKIGSSYPGLTVDLEYDMSMQAPRSLKYCFAAIIQEALTNTVKHSDATGSRVIIQEHPALYQLMIRDNGTVQYKGDGNGMGLDNMKERADAFGGTLRITSERGFCIFLSVPKKQERREPDEGSSR